MLISKIEALRNDTPGCDEAVHLNNAGCSPPTLKTIDTQLSYIQREARIGGYELAEEMVEDSQKIYAILGKLIGAHPQEIGFCEGSTDAWRRVLHALPLDRNAKIAVDSSIYGSNLLVLQEGARRFGWEIHTVRTSSNGTIDLEELECVAKNGVDLVAVTHIPAHSGAITSLSDVSSVVRSQGALLLVDACQSVGQTKIDVYSDGIDCLVFTGRKYLRGPRGTGGLFVRRELFDRLRSLAPDLQSSKIVDLTGRSETAQGAVALELWERSWSSFFGLGAAVDYLLDLDQEWVTARIGYLAAELASRLRDMKGVVVPRRESDASGIVVFDLPSVDLLSVRDQLRAQKINIMYAGPQNAPLEMIPSRVRGWLRASVHYFNTEEELDVLVRGLAEVAS